jgi:hypothetical protein
MALRTFDDINKDPGRWYKVGEDPEDGSPIRAKVRRLPSALERKIRADHGFNKTVQENGRMVFETERGLGRQRSRAVAATVALDVRIALGDESAASRYGQALDKTFAVGDVLDLSKTVELSDRLKSEFFSDYMDVTENVVEIIDHSAQAVADREKELQGN